MWPPVPLSVFLNRYVKTAYVPEETGLCRTESLKRPVFRLRVFCRIRPRGKRERSPVWQTAGSGRAILFPGKCGVVKLLPLHRIFSFRALPVWTHLETDAFFIAASLTFSWRKRNRGSCKRIENRSGNAAFDNAVSGVCGELFIFQ